MLDVEKFVAGLHEYISRALSPLVQRLEALEARQPEKGEPGRDGADGKSVTVEDVSPMVERLFESFKKDFIESQKDAVAEFLDDIPPPKDGADGRDGRDGVDGKSVTIEEVTPILREWFESMPKPKDGVDGKDGKDGRDGVDGKSVTLDDVQPILENAVTKWALEFERRAQDTLQRAIDRIPAPKDGKDGKDGRDAFQLEDVELSISDDERTLTFAFIRDGARVERSIRLNHPIYRGIWKDGAYEKGDCVTFGGSAFIALRGTTSKPETDDSWKLCVKRGRDGRDGLKGDPGPPGPRGPRGETPSEFQTSKIR